MKKWMAVCLALAMALSLAACGSMPNNVGDVVSGNPGNSSSPSPSPSESQNTDDGIYPDEDGYADGFLGDVMHTEWFDFSINSAYTCAEFDGLTADDGYKFLVAEITISNTTRYSQPMVFYDFQIQWDVQEGEDEEEAYDFPLYEEVQDEDGESDYVSVSEQQLPTSWELGIKETRTGILLYQVPAGSKDYNISFKEYFEDDTEGDLFFVYFNAEER